MFNSCTEWQQRSHVDETVEVTELNRQGSCLPVIPINSCTDWQQQSCIDETVEVTEQNRHSSVEQSGRYSSVPLL